VMGLDLDVVHSVENMPQKDHPAVEVSEEVVLEVVALNCSAEVLTTCLAPRRRYHVACSVTAAHRLNY